MKTIALAIVVSALSVGVVLAQTPVAPSARSSSLNNVDHWTARHWNAAKAEWAKDKIKWAGCEQRSTDQKLAGRKSWAFLYHCMT